MKKSIIFLIIIDFIVAICFFLTYGPVNYFRDFLITTAMTSKDHKYLARIFYTDKMIEKVLSQNTVESFANGSDTSKIQIGENEGKTNYASSYEKEILDHKKSDIYKLIEFEYNGYDAYLVAIYDSKRVSLMQTNNLGQYGQTLLNMAKDNGALAAINAGGFQDPNGQGNGGTPMGPVIKNSKLVWGDGNTVSTISGFNDKGILLLTYATANQAIKQGMKDAVQFGPFLIVNGESAKINGNGGWGINPRTVLAQRKDGIVLFLVIDGNGANRYNWSGRGGATLNDVIDILERYGAYNAVNMDGGASTNLVIKNKLWNNPCAISPTGERELPNGWMVK
jgi:exopolysaccharide biosynthesis protein